MTKTADSVEHKRVIKLTEGSKKARLSAARLASVQVLYQMVQNNQDAKSALRDFINHRVGFELDGDVFVPADQELLTKIVNGAGDRSSDIEEMIAHALTEEGKEPVELLLSCILTCGIYELLEEHDVDKALIISEYLNVTDAFFEKKEIGLINGILDRVAKILR